jgi:invasion protein IalB
MKRLGTALGTFCLIVWSAAGAVAQTAPKASPPAANSATQAPATSSAVPDRTTASFGDWTLRCERRVDLPPPHRFCEIAQTIQRAGESGAQAQIALGRIAPGEPLRLTAILPVNATFQPAAKVVTDGRDGVVLELGWLRCLPAGCFSNAVVSDDTLRKLRLQAEPGRIEYRDGAGREIAVPLSFKGLNEAFDSYLRETAR